MEDDLDLGGPPPGPVNRRPAHELISLRQPGRVSMNFFTDPRRLCDPRSHGVCLYRLVQNVAASFGCNFQRS